MCFSICKSSSTFFVCKSLSVFLHPQIFFTYLPTYLVIMPINGDCNHHKFWCLEPEPFIFSFPCFLVHTFLVCANFRLTGFCVGNFLSIYFLSIYFFVYTHLGWQIFSSCSFCPCIFCTCIFHVLFFAYFSKIMLDGKMMSRRNMQTKLSK